MAGYSTRSPYREHATTDRGQAGRRALPSHLEVINESYMHRVAPGSESHFKVVVVSQAFEGQRLLGRHRQVNGVLADELAGAIHALALHTYTESEWQARSRRQRRRVASANPLCVSRWTF